MNDEVGPSRRRRRRRRRYVRPSIDRTVDRWVGGAAAADIHQFGRVLVKQLIVAIVRVAQIAETLLQVRQVASAEFVGRLRQTLVFVFAQRRLQLKKLAFF